MLDAKLPENKKKPVHVVYLRNIIFLANLFRAQKNIFPGIQERCAILRENSFSLQCDIVVDAALLFLKNMNIAPECQTMRNKCFDCPL